MRRLFIPPGIWSAILDNARDSTAAAVLADWIDEQVEPGYADCLRGGGVYYEVDNIDGAYGVLRARCYTGDYIILGIVPRVSPRSSAYSYPAMVHFSPFSILMFGEESFAYFNGTLETGSGGDPSAHESSDN